MSFRKRWPLGVLLLVLGCHRGPTTTTGADPADTPTGPDWFEDVTAARGIDFRHDPGPIGKYEMPQIMGSGGALFDFDGDGRLDVYLVQNAGPQSPSKNRLYHQEADGRFRDVSAGSGLDVAGFGMGVAVGDVNNDGRPDVLLTEFGRTWLFLNEGNGKFRDVSREARIENPSWGTSAAFFDYDRDGWLDLVVVNYLSYDPSVKCGAESGAIDYCNPSMFKGTVSRLFHNLGSQKNGEVKFEDVTVAAGLAALPGPGLGIVCADLTGDGWPDIFVANDGQPNRLWVNRHNGTFADEAASRGVALTGMASTAGNMGIACADVDGDGLLDLFVTHLGDEVHTLWRQDPVGFFRDESVRLGLTSGKWRGTGFGTAVADFDRDGWPDLVLVNGRVSKRRGAPRELPAERFWEPYADRNQLFVRTDTARFSDASIDAPSLCGTAAVARGLAVGDIDNDGAPDLLVTEIAGPARLLRNVSRARGHWLGVQAIDPKLNRDSVGSRINVRAGGHTYVGLVNPGGSYLVANDPRVHFGLGPAGGVELVIIQWWDGTTEAFRVTGIDRYVTLKRGEGIPAEGKP
jgi:enediyne biosynthesis protein E4